MAEPITYGESRGWSKAMAKAEEPQPDSDAATDSSPVQDVPVESSPIEQEQVTEQAPPTPSQPVVEPPFHEHPRWREVQQEKEQLRLEKQQLLETLQRVAPQPHAQPEVDPYAGMDPQTAEFYRQMDRRIEQKAAAIAAQQLQGITPAADNIRRELAEIKIAQFRRENPDIKPGSQEEAAIAGFVQQGFDLNTAKKLALFDKLETENRVLKTKRASVPQKVAASNTEASAGIPSGSGLPPRRSDWRDRAAEAVDKGGSFLDVANTLFGKRR